MSLFTSLDFELDDDDACQKIRADNEIAAGNKETANQQTDNSDERTDEDEEEEEEDDDEEDDDEETAASLVHSVEPATGKFIFYLSKHSDLS